MLGESFFAGCRSDLCLFWILRDWIRLVLLVHLGVVNEPKWLLSSHGSFSARASDNRKTPIYLLYHLKTAHFKNVSLIGRVDWDALGVIGLWFTSSPQGILAALNSPLLFPPASPFHLDTLPCQPAPACLLSPSWKRVLSMEDKNRTNIQNWFSEHSSYQPHGSERLYLSWGRWRRRYLFLTGQNVAKKETTCLLTSWCV